MNPFEYQKPTEKQLITLSMLRVEMSRLHKQIEQALPPGRCRSLAITKLEECSMWANKACVFELEAE